MNALVTVLDHDHADDVRAMWAEVEETFGVAVQYAKPFTHFSYHVAADEYDLDRVGPVLDEIATKHPPFTVRTTGLGVFTGSEPVIYVSVERSEELDHLHHDLWESCTPRFGIGLPYYAPDAWVPHVTLAQGARTRSRLPEITSALEARDLEWELAVDNLAVIEDGGKERGLRHTVALSG